MYYAFNADMHFFLDKVHSWPLDVKAWEGYSSYVFVYVSVCYGLEDGIFFMLKKSTN